MNLAKQVQRYVYGRMKEENRSLRDLAKSIGENRQLFWFALKKTKKGMTLETLEKISRAFGLRPWEFLREVETYKGD